MSVCVPTYLHDIDFSADVGALALVAGDVVPDEGDWDGGKPSRQTDPPMHMHTRLAGPGTPNACSVMVGLGNLVSVYRPCHTLHCLASCPHREQLLPFPCRVIFTHGKLLLQSVL